MIDVIGPSSHMRSFLTTGIRFGKPMGDTQGDKSTKPMNSSHFSTNPLIGNQSTSFLSVDLLSAHKKTTEPVDRQSFECT